MTFVQSLRQWGEQNPEQGQRFQQLLRLGAELKQELQPWGGPRSDWERNEFNLGSTLEDHPMRNLVTRLGSWRTMLPRRASETVVKIFWSTAHRCGCCARIRLAAMTQALPRSPPPVFRFFK